MSWIVKIWYFGQDALTSYLGEKFNTSWEDSLNVFHHIYSKEYVKKKMKVRNEIQEYPNRPVKDAFIDKLYDKNKVIIEF
jgi:hypothetical protein